MLDYIEFLPLGGSGEIGMNMNLYRYQGRWLMVDCGVTFGDEVGVEILMPDISFIAQRRKDLVGIVLTHAHEDHIGALPYLWDRLRVPLYATPFTAIIIKDKLKQAGLLGQVELNIIPLGGQVDLDPFQIEFISLTHSIPEANALAIQTQAGTIIHTGDWKIDLDPVVGALPDTNRLREYGDHGVLALVGDSTNAFVPGTAGSESKVREHLTRVIGEQKNRVIVTLFASNIARIRTCIEAAHVHSRKVVLAGRSLDRMYSAARECGYLDGLPEVLTPEQATRYKKHELLHLCTGSQGEARAALSKVAYGAHPFVRVEEDDTVIFSSREIPGNERDIYAIQNQLAHRGVKVIKDRDSTIHVSGHPARDDLKYIFELVRPQMVIPVHGEEQHLQEHARFAKECGVPQTLVPHNGALIALQPGAPHVIEEVHSGRWCVDGNQVSPYNSTHIKERFKMSSEGVAFVTFFTDRWGDLARPQISFVGLSENKKVIQRLQQDFYRELARLLQDMDPDAFTVDEKVAKTCQIAVRRATRNVCHKAPVVITHVAR